MKTILFPTDFSACADNAFGYALILARKYNAAIEVHHSFHLPVVIDGDEAERVNEDSLAEMAYSKMQIYLEDPFVIEEKIKIAAKVNFGMAVDNILMHAKECGADIIVMGTKGSSGIDELFIGSNSSKLIEVAPCPLLIVPETSQPGEIKRIVFATDMEEKDVQAIESAGQIAKLTGSKLKVVHVSESPDNDGQERLRFADFSKKVTALIDYGKISFELLLGWNVSEVLMDYITNEEIDLLALSTRKRGFISKIFNSSVAKKMVNHTSIPMLIYHS